MMENLLGLGARRAIRHVAGWSVAAAAVIIGNCNPMTRRDRTPIRSFNGRMDEMLVFRRALSAQEVRDLAQNAAVSPLVSQ
jgi:hypothetical protein